MKVLGIESSCDETAAAVVRDGHDVLGSVISSQVSLHAGYGGVIPELAARERFFLRIADFQAPLGKFGVAGNHDVKLDRAVGVDLADAMALGGVTLLRNSSATIERGGQSIALIGLDDWTEGAQAPRDVAGRADVGDYTIVLSHTPDALPPLVNQPAQGGARWIDLMLCGHLHGGQVRLMGWSPIVPSIYGDRFLSGWYDEGGAALLVSNGVGALYLPIRLGAEPQAHLIEIRRAAGRPREEA